VVDERFEDERVVLPRVLRLERESHVDGAAVALLQREIALKAETIAVLHDPIRVEPDLGGELLARETERRPPGERRGSIAAVPHVLTANGERRLRAGGVREVDESGGHGAELPGEADGDVRTREIADDLAEKHELSVLDVPAPGEVQLRRELERSA